VADAKLSKFIDPYSLQLALLSSFAFPAYTVVDKHIVHTRVIKIIIAMSNG
jgi:hypothetical protein